MAPTASAHNAAIACVGDALDQRKSGAGFADRRGGFDAHVVQRHLGGAQAVDRRIAAHRNAGRRRIDQKQRQAIAFVSRAGDRAETMNFSALSPCSTKRLGAVENIDCAVAARSGGDVGEVVARLPFGMRE